MTSTDLHIVTVPQRDPRLSRQVVHDPASRGFPLGLTVDTASWRSRTLRTYDPSPNPSQCHGECTGVAKVSHFNSEGFRKPGRVLTMDDAHKVYGLATTLDPFPGSWTAPAWQDTGSSGLGSSKAAQRLGLGGEYRWLFGGADEVVQSVVNGEDVELGTWWYDGMFSPKPIAGGGRLIEPTGARAGGHEYRARGYDEPRDLILIRCWWGSFRDVWLRRTHLAELLADDGDAHVQQAAA
jgi:hypothetical protein